MRKLSYFLVFIGLVLVIVLIPPFFIGQMAQHRIDDNVALLNKNQSVHLVLNNYQRHWFSSTANADIEITDQRILMRVCRLTDCTNPLDPMALKAELHIAHGPVFWRMNQDNHPTSLGVGLASVSGLFGLLHPTNPDQKPLLSMEIVLGFTGNTQITANSLDLQTLLSGQGATLVDKGVQLRLRISDKGNKLKGDISSNGFDLQEKTGIRSNLSEGFSLAFDEHRDDHDLWLGSWKFNLPRWEMVSPTADKPTFDWHGLQVEEERSQGSNETLNSTFNLSVQQFGNAGHYGPLSLTVKSDALDQRTYQSMRDLLEDMTLLEQNRVSVNVDPINQADRFQAQARMWMLQRQMISLFPQLVRHGAVFSIPNLSFKTPDGDLSATAKLAFSQNENVNAESAAPIDVLSLLESANTDVSVIVPKTLLRQVIIQANTLSQPKSRELSDNTDKPMLQKTGIDQSVAPASAPMVAQPVSDTPDQAQVRADQQLAEMVKQGILVEDKDQYHFAVRYDQKQLYLNQVETTVKDLFAKFVNVLGLTANPQQPTAALQPSSP